MSYIDVVLFLNKIHSKLC